jgi:GNAT superfamily N-acetyltransferase
VSMLAVEPTISVIVRSGKPIDHDYIGHTWVRNDSHTARSKECRRCYFYEQPRLIDLILGRTTSIVKVAHLEDDEDAIMGFAVAEPGVLHYLYVRKEVRRQGIARKLMSYVGLGDNAEYTHKPSFFGMKIKETWIYNPYRAFR